MIEVIGTYVLFLVMYPAAIAMYAAESFVRFGAWFAVGLVVLLLLRLWHARAVKIWLAAWFMPGTIICGAATLVPLPFAVWSAFVPGRCATLGSLFICLALNVGLVDGIAWIYRKLRRVRAARDKSLEPSAPEDASFG